MGKSKLSSKVVIVILISELVAFAIVSLVVERVVISSKRSTASFAAQYVRQFLVEGDLRTALVMIERGAQDQFTEIRYVSDVGEEILRFPPLEEPTRNQFLNLLNIECREPIFVGGNSERATGELIFRYSLVPSLYSIFGIYLLIAILSIPVILYIRSSFAREEAIRLRESSHAIEIAIAAQVSHDIRSPLTALQFVAKNLKNISDDERNLILRATSRVKEIADDMLIKHRESGSLHSATSTIRNMATENINLSELVTEIFEEKKHEHASRQNIALSLQSTSQPSLVNIDRKEIARVLSNVVNNAVESIGPVGGEVIVALRVSGANASVVIKDTGCGMSSELLTKVGTAAIRSGKSGGSGLGLFHAHQVVSKMNGKFSVQSRINDGTMITITFPIVSPKA